jgi:hypothetical protein
MKKEYLIAGGIILLLLWKFKGSLITPAKKIKATITPQPLENITAKQYQDALNSSSLPVGIISTSSIMQDAGSLPLTKEIKNCCCSC